MDEPNPNLLPPDTLNSIGVLKRREIEARLLAPLIAALGEEFGRERVIEVVRRTIVDIARQQGSALAESGGGCTLAHFAATLEAWKMDDALSIEVLEQGEVVFSFNVTCCRYAEMYQALGIPELGGLLSCNRDGALIQGFNPQVGFTRSQTIMEEAPFCDFRYVLKSGDMKTLLLMRHAKSSWKDPELADHERPLNKRGKLNAPRMGRLLRDQDLTPDLILSSTARRARQTADAVADLSGYQGELRLEDELYAAPTETCLEVLQGLQEDALNCVLLVGHNPGLEELLDLLTGEAALLPTAAIAQIALPINRWGDLTSDVEGRLLNLWNPKELP